MTQQNQPVGVQAAPGSAKVTEQPIPSTVHVPPTTEIPQQQLPHVAAGHAQLFKDGLITREGMERTIKNGGSVLFGGVVITKLENLPTPAQIAVLNAKTATDNLALVTDGAKRGQFSQAEVDAAQKALDNANAAIAPARQQTVESIDAQIAALQAQKAQQQAQAQPASNDAAAKPKGK